MTMMMKQGLLTWSPCHRLHSLCRVSHPSLKTHKPLNPNSVFKISAAVDGTQPNAGGFTGEDRMFLQILTQKANIKERLLSTLPATMILFTNAIMFSNPLQALAETCEADNSIINMNMPLLLVVALVGATVGGLLARQRKGELQRLNEQLRQINSALRRQAKIESYAPTLSYAPVSGRIAENEVIVDPRKQDLISRLKNGKNFLRNQDPERAFTEFKTALDIAQNLKDPVEEKKAARGLGITL